MTSRLASGSWADREDVPQFDNCLAMFEAISDHPECEGLSTLNRFFTRRVVSQYPGHLNHLCDPTAIFFLLCFNAERHGGRPAAESY